MLEQKLNELEQSDIYPFHMPGHKRAFLPFANPYAIDITEIEGFDNLHHATGILQEEQQKAADLYGAQKTDYLVIGSTCGLLAAVGGAGALLSKCITKSEIVCYEDLGAEAIRKLQVKDFPVIVVIDSEGNNLYETAIKKYCTLE